MKRRESGSMMQALGVLCVLGVSAAIAVLLALSRQAPPKEAPVHVGPLVDVMTIAHADVPVTIRGRGTVAAQVRAQIVPQVSGRVVKLHPSMVSGGFIKAGQSLFEIDPTDYTLAESTAAAQLAQAQAARATADAQLADAQARLHDAQLDMTRTKELADRNVATSREVEKAQVALDIAKAVQSRAQAQVATAAAQISSAQLALEKARLDVSRTRVTLPFDAVISRETVDEGQTLMAGQAVGEAYGTDAVEIAVPLEDNDLKWLSHVPVAGTTAPDADPIDAVVKAELMGRACEWAGKVVRTEAEVDAKSRMMHIVVEVDHPFTGANEHRAPLVPGAFVDVDIAGKVMSHVAPIPRSALRNEAQVWLAKDGALKIVPVQVARRDRDTVYIQDGLTDGDQLITSAIDTVTDGMMIRVPEQKVAAAPAAGSASPHE
ncbi:MAG: efflux RND transporter periplasmic adaptor subunit [Planctomycetes bacterium]|nr:efflux RND transporter periplasmic adaptor subunit [Planctomycetota bacterium]